MDRDIVSAFRGAVEAGDVPAVIATLADDITFNSPVILEPFRGIGGASLLAPRLFEVWEGLTYVGELHDGDTVGLRFEARVGGHQAQGIDLLRFDDQGLIKEITVMVRPLSALQALADLMTAALGDDLATLIGSAGGTP